MNGHSRNKKSFKEQTYVIVHKRNALRKRKLHLNSKHIMHSLNDRLNNYRNI